MTLKSSGKITNAWKLNYSSLKRLWWSGHIIQVLSFLGFGKRLCNNQMTAGVPITIQELALFPAHIFCVAAHGWKTHESMVCMCVNFTCAEWQQSNEHSFREMSDQGHTHTKIPSRTTQVGLVCGVGPAGTPLVKRRQLTFSEVKICTARTFCMSKPSTGSIHPEGP